LAQRLPQGGVVDQSPQASGKGACVARVNDHAARPLTSFEDVRDSGRIGAYDRNPASHRLDRRDRETLMAGGKRIDICSRKVTPNSIAVVGKAGGPDDATVAAARQVIPQQGRVAT
jgi:hypothetical protein